MIEIADKRLQELYRLSQRYDDGYSPCERDFILALNERLNATPVLDDNTGDELKISFPQHWDRIKGLIEERDALLKRLAAAEKMAVEVASVLIPQNFGGHTCIGTNPRIDVARVLLDALARYRSTQPEQQHKEQDNG